jgi:hypothetical protein
MAKKNPTGGRRAVPLDLPAQHIAILRDSLSDCLEGLRGDLEAPGGLSAPDEAHQEAEAYQRLLAGLARGKILVPDEAARAAVEAIAAGDDEASNYAEVVANHEALHGLLALLEREKC